MCHPCLQSAPTQAKHSLLLPTISACFVHSITLLLFPFRQEETEAQSELPESHEFKVGK